MKHNNLHTAYICKVLCFILSDDDFEIKSKIHSFNCLSCFYSYLELHDDFIFRNFFLFKFSKNYSILLATLILSRHRSFNEFPSHLALQGV